MEIEGKIDITVEGQDKVELWDYTGWPVLVFTSCIADADINKVRIYLDEKGIRKLRKIVNSWFKKNSREEAKQ